MSKPRNEWEFVLPRAFYVNYGDIDTEHEALIRIINDCAETLVDGVLEDFEEPFTEFVECLVAHFEHEEDYMRDLGYCGLEWHIEHHKECLQRMQKLIDNIRDKGHAGLHDLRLCFHDIIYDMAHADMKFGEFVVGLGLKRQNA
ncbi:MAG: hemerythrin family protein [Rhodospirillales bacterium]